MKYFYMFLVLLLLGSCKKDDDNPINPNENIATGYLRAYVNGINWQADKIFASKSGTNINLSAFRDSTEIKMQIINVNMPDTFAIGENEPGYTYFIKAKFTEKASSGSVVRIYTAYFKDYSYLTIKDISEGTLDADFVFLAYTEDFLDSVTVTGGAINIDY